MNKIEKSEGIHGPAGQMEESGQQQAVENEDNENDLFGKALSSLETEMKKEVGDRFNGDNQSKEDQWKVNVDIQADNNNQENLTNYLSPSEDEKPGKGNIDLLDLFRDEK